MYIKLSLFRSSPPEVLSNKDALKTWSKSMGFLRLHFLRLLNSVKKLNLNRVSKTQVIIRIFFITIYLTQKKSIMRTIIMIPLFLHMSNGQNCFLSQLNFSDWTEFQVSFCLFNSYKNSLSQLKIKNKEKW